MAQKRIIANLIAMVLIICFLVTNFRNYDRSLSFIVFTLPYLLSHIAILIMLILSTLNNPKEVNDSLKSFLISILGGNLSIFLGLAGVNLAGSSVNQQLSLGATFMSILIIPFYIISVFTLGRNLTVLPEANKLQTHGVYRISRHPLYLCYIIWYLLAIMVMQSWIIILTTLVQITLQLIRAKYEEIILEKTFPEYGDYKKRVGWFLKFGVSKAEEGSSVSC